MNYLIGDAIRINFILSPISVTGATITIRTPAGIEIVADAVMTDQGTIEGATKRKFTYRFQSVIGTHGSGRYSVVCTGTNGTNNNKGKLYFYLEAE